MSLRLRLMSGLGLASWAFALLPAAASAAPFAFSHQFGNFVRVDLADGTTEVVGPTGNNNAYSVAMAADGSGDFFSIDEALPLSGDFTFHRIDGETGASTLIGPIDTLLPTLEMGPDGQLYSTAGGFLVRVDRATAALSQVFALDPGHSYGALVASGGELYGVARVAPGSSCSLFRIDLAGQSETLAVPTVGCAFGAAADAQGRIWLAGFGGGGLITGAFGVASFRLDLANQDEELWGDWAGLEWEPELARLRGFAGVGTLGTVDVPVAGGRGLAAFAALLALGAMILLRRGG
jgi:hypothetical protein